MNESSRTVVARWESRFGKHWVELEISTLSNGSSFYGFSSPGHTGTLADPTETEAIEEMQRRVDRGWFQPDNAKHPLKRVK